MLKYPKMNTLFKRDENWRITDEICCPEFENIRNWLITEKIDGRNTRIIFNRELGYLTFKGRRDEAEIPTSLLLALNEMFSIEKFIEIFGEAEFVCLYGEGYGAKIQKGGGNYNKGNSFRLFDVYVNGWWLSWESIVEVAHRLGIKTVPCLGIGDIDATVDIVTSEQISEVAMEEGFQSPVMEGIVATSHPLMLFRNGKPIKFKLKGSDYK